MCPTCGKAFRVRANYYKHRKIHERTSVEQPASTEHQELIQTARNQSQSDVRMATRSGDEESTNVALTQQLNTQQTGLLETFAVMTFFLFNLRPLLL